VPSESLDYDRLRSCNVLSNAVGVVQVAHHIGQRFCARRTAVLAREADALGDC
jgi:hypothetical protein